MIRFMTLVGSLCLLMVFGLPRLSVAAPQNVPASRSVQLWDGQVRLTLPRLAQNPVQADGSGKLFSILPTADRPDLKFIAFVARDSLRADEKQLSNQSLFETVNKMLEGLGYEVSNPVYSNSLKTFWLDFSAVMEPGTLPWQKVGPGLARGTAKFVRVGDELIGSFLLCDPSQWKNATTRSFIRVIGATSVAQP